MPKISDLSSATSVSATDQIVVVQSGTTKKANASLVRTYATTAAESAASPAVTIVNPQYEPGNVLRYGTNTTPGTTDMTAAIDAADQVMCAGNLGLDGVTVIAEGAVRFPPGTYRHTGLTYRGAPWIGDGINTTTLMYYGSGASVNAVGTTGARKQLNISGLSLNGTNASAGAYGLRLGHNYRSFGALRQVDIRNFPSYGILFDADSWQMSFEDVYIVGCATGSGAGIGKSGTPTALIDFNWFNLQLENNGQAASSTGGGIELLSSGGVVKKWAFFGGLLQGNKGAAEANFVDCDSISWDALYSESDLAAAGVTDGIIFGGTTNAKLTSPFIACVSSHGGKAIVAKGTSKLTIDNPLIHANWPVDISVEGTAVVTLLSNGSMNDTSTVVDGASLIRVTPKSVALTDAATIAVNAALGTIFSVTLAGNRAMGTPTNPSDGQKITFIITQDATGGRTLNWTTSTYFKHSWTDTGNVSTCATSIDFVYHGTRWKQLGAQQYYTSY